MKSGSALSLSIRHGTSTLWTPLRLVHLPWTCSPSLSAEASSGEVDSSEKLDEAKVRGGRGLTCSETGACLEYFLDNDLLAHLERLAQYDRPHGIKGTWFCSLLCPIRDGVAAAREEWNWACSFVVGQRDTMSGGKATRGGVPPRYQDKTRGR